MPAGNDALGARVRALCGAFASEAAALAAELLDAIEAARDVLAPAADEIDTPAGMAAGVAFQILADAAASAKPSPEPHNLRTS